MECFKLCPLYDYEHDKCSLTGRHPQFMQRCANAELGHKLRQQAREDDKYAADGSDICDGYAGGRDLSGGTAADCAHNRPADT